MNDKLNQTVRIRRPAKIGTDEQGRSVWKAPVEEIEFELVSTQMLTKLLDTEPDSSKQQLANTATGKDGVLARNVASKEFEIIDDDELLAALGEVDKNIPVEDVLREAKIDSLDETDDEHELSLVSTQALRLLLEPEIATTTDEQSNTDDSSNFDPYNSG